MSGETLKISMGREKNIERTNQLIQIDVFAPQDTNERNHITIAESAGRVFYDKEFLVTPYHIAKFYHSLDVKSSEPFNGQYRAIAKVSGYRDFTPQ
ncbi:MAG: hypothetical protein ACEQSL_05920 [Sediminibacterium sp.]